MTVVCDYSSARPDLAALKAAGIDGIVRYCTRFGLTAAEVSAALAAGLTVTLVMESGSQPALGGYPAGVIEGRQANAVADTVGYDPQATIYYVAEDPNRVAPSQWPAVDSYFAGVASVGGRPAGAYGGLLLVQHLLDTRLATKGWVVRPWGGVNGNVHLAQELVGVPAQFDGQIDIDTVLQADYGQMPRPEPPMTPAELQQIIDGVTAAVGPQLAVIATVQAELVQTVQPELVALQKLLTTVQNELVLTVQPELVALKAQIAALPAPGSDPAVAAAVAALDAKVAQVAKDLTG